MSKVKVGKISNVAGTSSINTTTLTGGSNGKGYPKAWAVFAGNPGAGIAVTVYDSVNVTSVTDSGSGIFTVNFAAGTFTNIYYAVGATYDDDATSGAGYASVTESLNTKTASACGITTFRRSATYTLENAPFRVNTVFYGS